MTKCPDCGGELENGALLDGNDQGALIQRYAKVDSLPADFPKKVIMSPVETNFKDVRRVLAYRCTKCNKIQIYAQEVFVPGNYFSSKNTVFGMIVLIVFFTILLSFIGLAVGLLLR